MKRAAKCRLCERPFEALHGNMLYCQYCAPLVKRLKARLSKERWRARRKGQRCGGAAEMRPARLSAAEMRPARLTRGEYRAAMACAGMTGVRTVDGIMSAKSKPEGMSDVRWRIELRRRRDPHYYAICRQAL